MSRLGRLNRFFNDFDPRHISGVNVQSIMDSALPEYYCSLRWAQAQASLLFQQELEPPSSEAIEKTEEAVRQFCQHACRICYGQGKAFPLAGRNKCLGVAVVPNKRLVLLAVSQDKNPETDLGLRKEMLELIKIINQQSQYWKFELASIPTKEEYILVRSIGIRTDRRAHEEEIEPRSRCVEVSLSIALYKTGRFNRFDARDVYMLSLGCGGLWASDNGKTPVVECWKSDERNTKYMTKPPLALKLEINHEEIPCCIDIWDPCESHCKKFAKAMRALSVAGGRFGSRLLTPRAECDLFHMGGQERQGQRFRL